MSTDVSALVLLIPEVEPVVGAWRDRFDADVSNVPAHVTVLFPWIPPSLITGPDLDAVATIAATTPATALRFADFGEFPDVLWLDRQPAQFVHDLTTRVAARWPAYPPYGGEFPDPRAHLTIASTRTPAWADIRADITAKLPIEAAVGSLAFQAPASARLRIAQARRSRGPRAPRRCARRVRVRAQHRCCVRLDDVVDVQLHRPEAQPTVGVARGRVGDPFQCIRRVVRGVHERGRQS